MCSDSACTSGTNRTFDTEGDVGQNTSIAIGDDGNPLISYYDDTNDYLELYVCDNPTCSSGTNLTLDTDGGQYTSIVIGDDGNPVISHHDSSGFDLEVYVR